MRKLLSYLTILLLATISSYAQWETIEIDGKVDIDEIFTVNNNVFALVNTEDGVDGSGSEKLYVSNDDGASFTDVSANLPEEIGGIHSAGSHNGMVLLGTNVGVYMSSDNGQSWIAKNNGIEDSTIIYSFDSFNGELFAGAQGALYKSNDDGGTWSEIPFQFNFAEILGIAKSDSVLYIKLRDHELNYRVYLTTNGGDDWSQGYETNFTINDIQASNSGRSVMFGIETGSENIQGFIISSDYGQTFTQSTSLINVGVHSLLGLGETIFIGYVNWDVTSDFFGNGFVYRNSSTDNEWTTANDGITDLSFIENIEHSENYIFISSFDSSFARRPLAEFGVTTDVEETDEIPIDFALAQNYPNPFNPSTTIRFSLPMQSSVSLKVYDVIGKEVAELVNTEKPAGTYEVDFNAENLSSGIYFYTLKTNNSVLTKKMMLIK